MDNKKLIQAVQQDPTLSSSDKADVIDDITAGKFDATLVHGAIGAGVGLAISAYFNMSKPAQALLTIAGFGIGKYLLEESKKRDKFLQYDKDTGTYKINT